jgi:hypothetical protein
MPTGNPGNAAAAVAQVRQAVQLLQTALKDIPIGTALHEDVLKSITKLSSHAPASQANPGIEQQAMVNNANQMQKMAPMVSMMKALGGAPGQESPQPQTGA